MGFFILSLLFTTRRGWESDSERRNRHVDTPPNKYTPGPESLYEKLDGTLSWIDTVSMIISMLEREGGDGKDEAKVACDRGRPHAPFSLRVFSALSYFLIKQSSGFI
jgi:hypothetical protein